MSDHSSSRVAAAEPTTAVATIRSSARAPTSTAGAKEISRSTGQRPTKPMKAASPGISTAHGPWPFSSKYFSMRSIRAAFSHSDVDGKYS